MEQAEGHWSVPCRTPGGEPAWLDVTLIGTQFTLAVNRDSSAVASLKTTTGDALANALFQAGRYLPMTMIPFRTPDGLRSSVRVAVFGDLVTLAISRDEPVSLTGEQAAALGHALLRAGGLALYAQKPRP